MARAPGHLGPRHALRQLRVRQPRLGLRSHGPAGDMGRVRRGHACQGHDAEEVREDGAWPLVPEHLRLPSQAQGEAVLHLRLAACEGGDGLPSCASVLLCPRLVRLDGQVVLCHFIPQMCTQLGHRRDLRKVLLFGANRGRPHGPGGASARGFRHGPHPLCCLRRHVPGLQGILAAVPDVGRDADVARRRGPLGGRPAAPPHHRVPREGRGLCLTARGPADAERRGAGAGAGPQGTPRPRMQLQGSRRVQGVRWCDADAGNRRLRRPREDARERHESHQRLLLEHGLCLWRPDYW
mmetsp:Transcript_7408/g.20788  ORF Transcript_7408/g.20788 Transcript_7408/m.20788 type:complete len:295 (-) Transcript_7408:628-1512(-)